MEMKRFAIVFMTAVLVCGCVERKMESADGFDKTEIVAACDQIISDFQASLKQELTAALADGGPAAAISVCNVKAPVLADSFSNMPGIDIRRVSLRQRNPQYTPDSFEVEALERFHLDNSPEPETYSRVVFDSGGVRVFRYMKEIKVGQLCLNCHGDPKNFSKPLKEALAENYPQDRAVGYEVGDSRGAFSVIVEYPRAKETVTAILSEQGR
jgi:hypothetical protein